MGQDMSQGLMKWEKWLLLGGPHIALSAFVYYFNIRVFGEEDAKFYVAPLAVMAIVSFIAARHIHTGGSTSVFRTRALQAELSILAVLLLNVCISMMVLREMSLAGQAEKRMDGNLERATKLKSLEAQDRLVAAVLMGKGSNKIQVFQEKEKILVGLLFLELLVAMGWGLVLVAYSVGDADKNGKVDFFEEEEEEPEPPAKKGKKQFTDLFAE